MSQRDSLQENVVELKIILLGDVGVGKTNIISRYISGDFNQSLNPTVGSSFGEKKIKKEGVTYLLKVWDTVGQERYNSITKLFVQGSHIIILVYSIDNLQSFQKLNFWLTFIRENLTDGKYILALIANKSDLFERQKVSDDLGREFAEKNKMKFNITSAKDNSAQFKRFLIELLQEYVDLYGENLKKNNSFGIKSIKKKKKSKC